MKWRNVEKIDEIHLENRSNFEIDYPQYSDTVNKYGFHCGRSLGYRIGIYVVPL